MVRQVVVGTVELDNVLRTLLARVALPAEAQAEVVSLLNMTEAGLAHSSTRTR